MSGREVIFHLCSLIAIPYSYVAPKSYVATNVLGALNVFHAARAANVERDMHTSTSECYGTARYVPIDEKHPQQRQSPYSANQNRADAIPERYQPSYKLPE